jgi:uncharacterized protein (TIGR02596 family)
MANARDKAVAMKGGKQVPGRSCQSFSLVELLVVLAIIAILATVSSLALAGLTSSLHVTQASEALHDILLMARSTAQSHSHVVEVRFFQCTNSAIPNAGQQWCALQAVEILENASEQPVGPATFLPNGVIMSSSAANSSLLQTNLAYTATITPSNLGAVTSKCRYRYLPDGSTDLVLSTPLSPATQWSVTIYNANDRSKGDPPPNYATVVVEPFTGAVTTIRP